VTGLDRFADLFAPRDSSLALAAGALARIADDQGRASFSDLAIAYREEFLKLQTHAKGEVPDAGSLSVDDARAYLANSVLPRLPSRRLGEWVARSRGRGAVLPGPGRRHGGSQ